MPRLTARPLIALVAEPGLQVALVHSAFNLSAALLALLMLPWIWRRLGRFTPAEEGDGKLIR